MTKNHFKLFKSDVPKAAKGVPAIKKHGNDKPKRQMSEFDARLLALQERSTKKNNGIKNAKVPLVIAQPTFVLPSQAAPVQAEVDLIEGLLPTESTLPAPVANNRNPKPSQQNSFTVLADDEDKYKIKLAPSLFTLPPRELVNQDVDPDL